MHAGNPPTQRNLGNSKCPHIAQRRDRTPQESDMAMEADEWPEMIGVPLSRVASDWGKRCRRA